MRAADTLVLEHEGGVLRILHIIDGVGVGGGAEESLVGMLPRLRERGIDGQVICLYPRDGHEEALRATGFRVDVLNNRTLLGRALTIRRAIRNRKPDLVHASLIDACLATRVAMLGLQTPQLNSLVNTTYDPVRVSTLRVAPWKMRLLQVVDALTSRWVAPGFHALTEAVKKEAVEVLRIPPSKVWVVPRGRDSQALGTINTQRRSRVREGLGVSDDQVMVLNVGRQDPQKGKTLLVEAFSQAASEHPEAILFIAGREANDTPNLLRAVEQSPVSERIRVLGHRDDVADLLSAADLFVFPSHYEGLGGALVEALCMGCPAIGSDAPAIAEVLGHGEFGIVVPRGDVTELARAMSELIGSPAKRELLSRKGQERFRSSFELSTVIDSMAQLYRDLTQSRPQTALPARLTRRVQRVVETFRNRLALLESAPVINAREGRQPADGLGVRISRGIDEYRSTMADYSAVTNRFAKRRFDRGAVHIGLVQNGSMVAWCWVSGAGVDFPVLEIGRTMSLAPDERVVFDVETEPAQRGKGHAEALIRATQETFASDKLIAYVLTDNVPSLRVFNKTGFRHLGDVTRRTHGLLDHREDSA